MGPEKFSDQKRKERCACHLPSHRLLSYFDAKKTLYIYIYALKDGWKGPYDDVISAVDIFDQLDPITTSQMEEMCGLQEELCLKILFT